MRAFVALEIPSEQVLEELVRFQHEVSESGADLKIVERENLHFTVKFLGEISEELAREADRRLAALSLQAVGITVRGVGAFPGGGRPRVVWVGVAPQEQVTLGGLAASAIGALEGIGERDERGFQPHVTLARVRSERNNEALVALIRRNSEREFGRARLAELKLKSSVLTPRGPIYRDVGVYSLK